VREAIGEDPGEPAEVVALAPAEAEAVGRLAVRNWSGRMPIPTRFDRWMRS
jgi:hypothetical protein